VRSAQRFRNATRQIDELQWAKIWEGKPPHSGGRLNPKQREGKAYEEALTKWLPSQSIFSGAELLDSPWIRFEDSNGMGFAQPDIVALFEDELWIFEAKLTYVASAHDQLERLYSPLLAEIYPDLPQQLVVACNNLAAGSDGRYPNLLRDLSDIYLEDEKSSHVFHWRKK
jgi:hypothetical protein